MDKDTEIGLKIDKELDALFKAGKKEFDVDDLEKLAPETYECLYECCEEEDSENGLETSHYRLIEDSKTFKFKLTKK